MELYCQEKQDHHNRQVQFDNSSSCARSFLLAISIVCFPVQIICEGNLDVKYLDDRYKRGLEKVAAYMDSHQQYVELKDINDALPFFIEHNQKSGCQFLGCSVVVNLPTVKQLQFDSGTRLANNVPV